MPNYNDAVTIVGSSDEAQLVVQGYSAQTEPLQEWQDSSADPLARLTADGRLQIGSFDEDVIATSAALIEVSRAETDTAKPKRGLHLSGAISGALNSFVAWVVSELTLKGTNGLSAIYTALRVRARNEATGSANSGAELRGADIDVTHAGTWYGLTLTQVVGVNVGVNQETGTNATSLYGIKIDLTNPSTGAYALHANHGKVLLGDLGTGIVQAVGGELSVIDQELGGSSRVVATWGEAVSPRDAVYLNASDNKWYKAENDAVSPVHMSGVRGFVSDAGTGAINTMGTVLQAGLLTGFSGLVAGTQVYVSGTAGGYTQTEPTLSVGGSQVAIAEMGYAVSTSDILVDTKAEIRYLKREIVLAGNTITLEHHSDAGAETREVFATLSANDISKVEEHASTNQDASLALNGPSGLLTIDGTTGLGSLGLGTVSGAKRRLAQSFQVTGGVFKEFTVKFGQNTGSPVGDMGWSLETDNADKPSGTAISSGTFTPNVPGTLSAIVNTIPATTKVVLKPNTKYWLVLTPVVVQANGVYWQMPTNSAGTYANGIAKADSTTPAAAFPGTWPSVGGANAYDMQWSVTTVGADALAQGFQLASGQTLASVKLYLRKVGAPTGTLTCAVCADSSGNPGSVITNGTANAAVVSASSLSTSYEWVEFYFPIASRPTLAASTPYHLKLTTSDSQSNTNYVEWGVDMSSPSYANGGAKAYGSSSWSVSDPASDACFEVYALGTGYLSPALLGRWNANGAADFGVRYNDSTHTFLKNHSALDRDITFEVLLA